MGRVFTSGPRDRGSIPGRVIPKAQKIVLDASLLNTQHYKGIKGKVEQSREGSNTPPQHLCVVANEKGAFGSPLTMVSQLYFYTYIHIYIYIYIYIYMLQKVGQYGLIIIIND